MARHLLDDLRAADLRRGRDIRMDLISGPPIRRRMARLLLPYERNTPDLWRRRNILACRIPTPDPAGLRVPRIRLTDDSVTQFRRSRRGHIGRNATPAYEPRLTQRLLRDQRNCPPWRRNVRTLDAATRRQGRQLRRHLLAHQCDVAHWHDYGLRSECNQEALPIGSPLGRRDRKRAWLRGTPRGVGPHKAHHLEWQRMPLSFLPNRN
jgi:hypothetical protein